MRAAVVFLIFTFFALSGASQSSFAPNISSYKSKDYNANPFIYDIVQNDKGLLYFANQRGLLEYDGERWKLIETNKSSEVNCIEILPDNTILLGTESGFGVIEKNSNGVPVYKDTTNLLDSLNEPIVDIASNDDYFLIKSLTKVFAFTHQFKLLFFYSNPELDNGENLRSLSSIDNAFYFQDPKRGIISFKDNVFKKVHFSDIFNDKIVNDIEIFQGDIHIITRDSGIFRWMKKVRFQNVYYNPELAAIRTTNIGDQLLALGTYSKGVLVLDKYYQTVYELNNSNGLIDNGVRSTFLDHHNQLWVGTTNGVSKIDILSSVVTFKEQLKGIVIEDINAYNNNIIISTLGGVYRVDPQMQVSRIEGINSDCFGLTKVQIGGEEHFFISELYDVYELQEDFSVQPVSHGGPYKVLQSPLNENHLLVLHYNGIEVIEKQGSDFKRLKYVKDFSKGEPFNFIVTQKGEVWIGTKPNDGIYMTSISSLLSDQPKFKHFHTGENLPEGPNYLMEHQGKVYSATEGGVFIYNGKTFDYTNRFGFFDDAEKPRLVHRMNTTKDGTVWAVIIDSKTSTAEFGFSRVGSEGVFEWYPNDFVDFSDYIIHSIFHHDNGTTWLGGTGDGLLKYNEQNDVHLNTSISVYLRSVKIGDSLFYDGFSVPPSNITFDYNPQTPIEFSFGNNFFKDEGRVKYAFFLEGYMNEWSSWNEKSTKEFSLQEGEYTLHIKALNSYGVESEVVQLSIKVNPPWYRTLWAYILYVVILIVIVLLIVRVSLVRIKQQNIRLEKLVEERTKEVTNQKAEAEKQRDIAEEQKKIVEEKNSEILDSINYAQRIQSAILPSDRVVREFFEDYFILYQPKDIVAGDFYWLHSEDLIDFEQKDQKKSVYLAAADCTGHGVPGAMVSVVCNNALNISVNEFKCKRPSDILNKSRELVISEFGKSSSDIKDGMDIALCRFSFHPTPKIEFAGANNPLWIIRNKKLNGSFDVKNKERYKVHTNASSNDFELLEIKSDKQPIGKFITNDPFTNHEIDLKKGDQIYMFSDGYQDQFGGLKDDSDGLGKKFKASQLRQLLISIQELPMSDQKKVLKEEFEKWRGKLEQVDDVCVVGVRL